MDGELEPVLAEQLMLGFLAPSAASFFSNFRQVKRMWRKRVGVEPTPSSPAFPWRCFYAATNQSKEIGGTLICQYHSPFVGPNSMFKLPVKEHSNNYRTVEQDPAYARQVDVPIALL